MAKIQSFPKVRLHNAEWLAACDAIYQKILAELTSTTNFSKVFTTYETAFGEYSKSMTKLTKSEYTLKSNVLRKKNNALRSAIFNIIRGDVNSSNLQKQTAAISLSVVVSRFVNLSLQAFEKLIGNTDKLIEYFESDEFKVHITTLDLNDRVTALKAVNTESKVIYEKKIEELGRRATPRKSRITRYELNKAYDQLVVVLNSLAVIEGDQAYISLFTWWNAMIDSYRVKLSLRLGATAGGRTDNGKSNIPGEKPGEEEDRPEIH